jgi:pantoate--beta-alanine ligase
LKICKTISELNIWRDSLSDQNIGFVPTMGSLHQGHLSLVSHSKNVCKKTIVSIFVNELQFSPDEDFDQYPRSLDEDIKFLNQLKVDVVFLPTAEEIYSNKFSVVVNELNLSQKLEGNSRPGFFLGVTTIVSKLFNMVRPSHAFFGEKDIQQLIIIKKLVQDLNYNIKVIGCKTIREKSGLAMSSRNQYLSNTEKEEAAILYQTLQLGLSLLNKNQGYLSIQKSMKDNIVSNPKIKFDYFSIAALNTLNELKTNIKDHKAGIVISGAIFLNHIRLIDNILIE